MDSNRKLLTKIFYLCEKLNIGGWREYNSSLKKLKKQLRKIQKSKHSTSINTTKREAKDLQIKELYKKYISMSSINVKKAKSSLIFIFESGHSSKMKDNKFKKLCLEIEEYLKYSELFIDQIRKRVIDGAKIPHDEKIFSIFEKDTEWISKGKSGIRHELGINVCIITDENGLILNHRIMRKETDSSIAIPFIKETQEKYTNLSQCSFDKGFHSPQNQKVLSEILDYSVLPTKGRLSDARKKIEYSDKFRKAKMQHPAVESSIAALKNHGFDYCPDKGNEGFDRYAALGIVGRNIEIIGAQIRKKLIKKKIKTKKRLSRFG